MFGALSVQVQPKHGNIAAKVFPVTGYYGVTPVALAGTVRVKIQEGAPSIPVRSVQVAVRCYESREGIRTPCRERTVWEKSKYIWHPPAGTQDDVLDGWEQPFKISIPPEAAGLARGTQHLREWRVRWRLEVMVEHVPIPHVGHRVAHAYDINVYDHRTPSSSLPSPPAGMALGSGATTTRVHINPPPTAFGPSEGVPVSFSVCPDDPGSSIKKLQLVLDRRVELLDGRKAVSESTDDLTVPRRSRMHNLFRGTSPLPSRGASEGGDNVLVARIAETQCEIPTPGPNGAVWSMGTLQLPRRGHNWAVGETARTEFANISFEARLKVTIKSKRGGTQKELVSQPVPVTVVGSTAEERAEARKAWERLDARSARRVRAACDKEAAPCSASPRDKGPATSVMYLQEAVVLGSAPCLATPARCQRRDCTPPSTGASSPARFSSSSRSLDGEAHPVPRTILCSASAPADESNSYPTTPSHDDPRAEIPRSRLKREHASEPPSPAPRRRLFASLDALGLGLPKVAEETRRDRPATAPSFGTAPPRPFGARPQTSGGLAYVMPAPR